MFRLLVLIFLLIPMVDYGQNSSPDTLTTRKLKVGHGYFSPCDAFGHQVAPWIKTENRKIEFICYRREIVATDRNEKKKWVIDTRKLSNEFVSLFREFEYGKYDVILQLEDGSFYVLRSKNGKAKQVSKEEIWSGK